MVGGVLPHVSILDHSQCITRQLPSMGCSQFSYICVAFSYRDPQVAGRFTGLIGPAASLTGQGECVWIHLPTGTDVGGSHP